MCVHVCVRVRVSEFKTRVCLTDANDFGTGYTNGVVTNGNSESYGSRLSRMAGDPQYVWNRIMLVFIILLLCQVGCNSYKMQNFKIVKESCGAVFHHIVLDRRLTLLSNAY